MDNHYELIKKQIINNHIFKIDFISDNLMKNLETNDIKKIDNIVKTRTPLKNFICNNTKYKKHMVFSLISKALPIMYNQYEIREYFVDCIAKIQSTESTWTKYSIKNFYKEIMGLDFSPNNNPNNFLYDMFRLAYKQDITIDKLYPTIFINNIINNINENKPLINEYHEFYNKYQKGKCKSFLSIISNCIIPIIGEDEFFKYVQIMTNKFKKNVEFVTIQTLNLSLIQEYIFGYKWPIDIRNINKLQHINLIVIKAIFPTIVQTYRNYNQRNKFYKAFEYDEKTIQRMETIAKQFDSENYRLYPINDTQNIKDFTLGEFSITTIYEKMSQYMEHILKSERTIPTYHAFLKDVFEYFKIPKLNYTSKTTHNALLHAHYDKLVVYGKELLYQNNKNEYNKDKWQIYYKKNERYKSILIDFSSIPNCKLKSDLKEYIKEYINEESTTTTAITQVNTRFIDCFVYITNQYNIQFIKDIEEWMILSYLNELDTNRHLSPTSINHILSGIKKVFLYFDLIDNPTENIKISNIKDHQKPTPIIPNDILVFLDNNIDRIKQTDVKLIYKILSQTGWRLSDIRNLTINSISKLDNNNEFALISVKTNKTRKSRIKNRLGDIIEDYISIDLYNEIVDYIKSTKNTRSKLGTDILFFRIVNGVLSTITPSYYDRAINTLLKENNIKSIDETYTHFSAMQSRKTVASNLISNNVSEADIQKKLGHVSKNTTRHYYMEVERKKLSELNHEFYKKKFDIYIDEEKLKLFTEEERKILYVDFCLGKRQVELGECSKHPSEGRCVSLGYNSCAKCPKLCTGKKYLNRWIQLEKDSKKILDMFISEYSKYNIPQSEYCNYIEYRQENELHEYYLAVIDKITKEG